MSSRPRAKAWSSATSIWKILDADSAVISRVERLAAPRRASLKASRLAAPRLVVEPLAPFQRGGHLINEVLRSAPEDQHAIAKAVECRDRCGMVLAACEEIHGAVAQERPVGTIVRFEKEHGLHNWVDQEMTLLEVSFTKLLGQFQL